MLLTGIQEAQTAQGIIPPEPPSQRQRKREGTRNCRLISRFKKGRFRRPTAKSTRGEPLHAANQGGSSAGPVTPAPGSFLPRIHSRIPPRIPPRIQSNKRSAGAPNQRAKGGPFGHSLPMAKAEGEVPLLGQPIRGLKGPLCPATGPENQAAGVTDGSPSMDHSTGLAGSRSTRRYKVSRSTGSRPASVISSRIRSTDNNSGVVAPAS